MPSPRRKHSCFLSHLLCALAIGLLAALTLTGGVTLASYVQSERAAVSASPTPDAGPKVPAATVEPSQIPAAAPEPTPEAEPEPVPEPEPDPEAPYDYAAPVPQSEAVGDDWFADAAFVGDSRTEGLCLYSGVKAGACLAYRGLTVQSARTDPSVRVNGVQMTALEGLRQGAYAKVYIMLGVNELGWYNDQRYYDNYADLIDLARQAQPQARIYLQTLIPVTAEKSEGSYINNPQILVYNEIITRLAEEKQVYLLDTWSAFAGEDGALDPEGSVDGVHLTRSYYQRWLDYLKTHTVTETD